MNYRGKFLIAILSAGIAFYAFFGVIQGWWLDASAQQPINDPGAQIRIFESVLQHIQNDYVDEPDLRKVRNGALKGLAEGLDPYTSYLSAAQVNDYRSGKVNGRVGIGAEFSQVSAYLYVISVTKGSPAEKAGLLAGDVIEYIDAKATRDISLYDAKQLILGEPGTKVRLRVLRSRAKPRTIEVARGRFDDPAPEAKIVEGGIGILTVHSLAKGQADKIRSKLEGLAKEGIAKLIVDLRNVAGGDLEESVRVANLLIGDGDLAKVIGREEKVINTFSAIPAEQIFRGPVAVLIDLGSAGGAEVVASAVLDRKRGEVVGEKSFGAGTEQKLFTLKSGDGFLLTTAKWASAEGKPFLAPKRAAAGVKPSVEVKRPETPEPDEVAEMVEQKDEGGARPVEQPEEPFEQKPKKQEDVQLLKAIEILKGKAAAGAV